MAPAYRDEAIAERIAQLDERIAELEAGFTEAFWTSVASVWRVPRALDRSLGPLEARHVRVACLEAARQRALNGPAVEPLEQRRATSSEPHEPEAVRGLLDAVHTHDAGAGLLPQEGGGWGTRIEVGGSPIDVRLIQLSSGKHWRYAFDLETAVAPAARLSLKAEGFLQDLLELAGLKTEIETGDTSFDPVFEIEGDPATARDYLTAPIRKELLGISVEHTPYISIVAGRARIRSAARGRRANACALRVLAAWHQVPSPHALLEPPNE